MCVWNGSCLVDVTIDSEGDLESLVCKSAGVLHVGFGGDGAQLSEVEFVEVAVDFSGGVGPLVGDSILGASYELLLCCCDRGARTCGIQNGFVNWHVGVVDLFREGCLAVVVRIERVKSLTVQFELHVVESLAICPGAVFEVHSRDVCVVGGSSFISTPGSVVVSHVKQHGSQIRVDQGGQVHSCVLRAIEGATVHGGADCGNADIIALYVLEGVPDVEFGLTQEFLAH